MKHELVKDWMTRDVITTPSSTSLYAARRLMKEYRIRRLPIVDDGELVGIVTWGDLRGALPSEATTLSVGEINYQLSRTTLKGIMTPHPVTIGQNATVEDAARLLLAKKISALPVVDMAGNVIGIITESDIFRLAVRFWTNQEQAQAPAPEAPTIAAPQPNQMPELVRS